MTATEFELVGESEEELEEEAAELELLFPRGGAGTKAAPRKAPFKLTDPIPFGCIDVSGRCISDGCAAPYKCVRRLGGGCECRPGKFCPEAPDPASGKCLRELRRDGNYLVCCPKYYGTGDPCCRAYPIPSRLRKKTRDDPKPIAPVLGELDDEFEEEAMELEPLFARRGSFEFENPAVKKPLPPKVQEFLKQVRKRPQDFKKLLLTVALNPDPILENIQVPFPTYRGRRFLIDILLLEGITNAELADALKPISDDFQKNTAFKRLVEAERQLQRTMIETTTSVVLDEFHKAGGKSVPQKLKPFLLDSLQAPNPLLQAKVGLKFAQKMLPPTLAQRIIRSEASEAHLTRLGQMLQRHAKAFQNVDPAFKQLVMQKLRLIDI